MSAPKSPLLIHASCVAWGSHAALLCGPSGSGKSDLALRFLSLGEEAQLVADDQVELRAEENHLFVGAPHALAGLLEVRGLGLWRVASLPGAEVRLIVNLVPRDAVPRLPESRFTALGNVNLPTLSLHAFDASTPVKLRVALQTISRMPREVSFPGDDGKFS